jgi:hypothetical protein
MAVTVAVAFEAVAAAAATVETAVTMTSGNLGINIFVSFRSW